MVGEGFAAKAKKIKPDHIKAKAALSLTEPLSIEADWGSKFTDEQVQIILEAQAQLADQQGRQEKIDEILRKNNHPQFDDRRIPRQI